MDAMNPKWAAEVCRAAGTLLEANGLGRRTEQLRLVADCLDASVPSPNADTIATLSAEVERLRADAERMQFCARVGTFPVRDQSGEQWVMFVAVKSNRRSLFIGDTPEQAIDAARAADKGPERLS